MQDLACFVKRTCRSAGGFTSFEADSMSTNSVKQSLACASHVCGKVYNKQVITGEATKHFIAST